MVTPAFVLKESMIRAKWLMLAIAISLLVVSCSTLKQVEFNCDSSSVSSPLTQSKNLTIEMYVDGTPSMQGYVTHPTNTRTRYSETIDLLDRTLLTGWTPEPRNQPEVKYFRLGENFKEIDRNDYLLARGVKFYNGTEPKLPLLKVSKIDNAITPANEDKLTVIVTDLYQKDADVTQLKKRILAQNYFNQGNRGYGVGILAIRSEFNGDVYLEDGTNRKFAYTTNDSQGKVINGKEFRPFYVIFLGRYSDIADYFNKLGDSKKIPKDSHLTIFSPSNLVGEVSYLQRTPVAPKTTKTKDSSVISKGLKVRSSLKDRIKVNKNDKNELFAIDQNSTQDLFVKYDIPFQSLSNTLPVDPSSIEAQIKIETSSSSTNIQKSPGSTSSLLQELSKDSPLQKALEVSEWQINDKNLSFKTTIKPSLFPKRDIYLFTVNAVAKRVQIEPWWDEWNTTSNSSNDWKTYNLQPFMEGLKDNTDNFMRNSPVVVGRFCFAMQKN
jgi:hypothetical protein